MTGRSTIGGRLKFFFAAISALGGLVLTSGESTASLTTIAVFFAVFGYVFVDWLELFALPAVVAYAAMGLAALYCVSDFIDFDSGNHNQMTSVAQLLVFVQAILMLQRKTRRILEQLGVFCLLQLVVSAVFNDAIHFGVLLLPISIIAAFALSLLSTLSASDGIVDDSGLDPDDASAAGRLAASMSSNIVVQSTESATSLLNVAGRLPRLATATLAPGVLLIGGIFFYALPRTTDSARGSNQNNTVVGFSDEMRLEQIGAMMQSAEPAVRIRITDRKTGAPYSVIDGLYLRGKVLERYRAQFGSGTASAVWASLNEPRLFGSEPMPIEYVPGRSSDASFYDAVVVQASVEASRSNALFVLAPYYQYRPQTDVQHSELRWTLSRLGDDAWPFARATYWFGSHAFRDGLQTDLIADTSTVLGPSTGLKPSELAGGTRAAEVRAEAGAVDAGDDVVPLDSTPAERREQARQSAELDQAKEYYRRELLEFDESVMPTTAAIAFRLAHDESGKRLSDYEAAKRMERHLSMSNQYSYTLTLDAVVRPGLDPIEQFMMVDKRGHCQYFASALAMMLRSQGIPARMVVGYRTDEYNSISGYFLARQLHAHAWVEASIASDQIDRNRAVYGQPPTSSYWLRLDPTPSSGRISGEAGSVNQVIDLAQTMWDDYVVDMDGNRQKTSGLGSSDSNPMHRSYESLVNQLSNVIASIRSGDLGRGSLADGSFFSWPAAVIGIVLAVVAVVAFRISLPSWLAGRVGESSSPTVAQPSVPFYAETLAQLLRLGISRSAAQTPSELADDAKSQLDHPLVPSLAGPLDVLTKAYYQCRFGGSLSSTVEIQRSRSQTESMGTIDLDAEAGMREASQCESSQLQSSQLQSSHLESSDDVRVALTELTHSVDLLTIGQSAAE